MWNRKKCMRTRIHSGALSVVLLTVLALQPYYIYAENDKTDESDPIELYVSPEGSDEGQGTIDEPLATVSAARDMLRKLKNNNSSVSEAVVYLREGVYTQEDTLEFGAEDSGSKDFPITYKAYNGETAVIDGGITLSSEDFKRPEPDDPYASRIKDQDARESVVMYDLKAAGIDYSNDNFALYYDGGRGTLARYPNEQYILGFHDLSDGHRDDDRYMCNSADGTFYDKENVVSTWKNIDGVKVCGMFEIDWAQSSPADIVSYDADSNRVKVNATINGYSGRYYYSNVVEEIDTVGEYYIDKENGVLYFYAPENYLDIKISVPNIGKLISINDADNITLDGLVIENSTGTLVDVKADDVTIQNCVIRCGYYGIYSDGYRNKLLNNEIYRIGSTAVDLRGGDMTNLLPSNSVLSNNSIHDFGDIQRVYAGAIYAEGVGFSISHNEIYHSPHTAMQNLAMEMIVEYNYFHDLCYEGGDAGAIYDGTWRGNGNVFSNNVIANITNPTSIYYTPNGYYCDDGGGGKTFTSNICVNIDGDAIFFGGGPSNIVTDNIIVNSGIRYDQRAYYPGTGANAGWTLTGKFGVDIDTSGLNWRWMMNGMKAYASESWAIHFPWTMLLKTTNVVDLNDNFVSYAFLTARIRNNVIAGNGSNDIQNNTERLVNVRDNISGLSVNQIFADYGGGDYTVLEDSVIYHDLPGFRACDFSKVGIQE